MATVRNEEDNIIVYGTDLNDNLFNENVNVKIFGYEGNDTIENRGYEVIIEGGAGNDYIYSDVYSRYGSENYRRATIYGGTGNDTIRVNDNETSLMRGQVMILLVFSLAVGKTILFKADKVMTQFMVENQM